MLHVVDFDDGGTNDSLGQVVIELDNFDVEAGFHGSFELADLVGLEIFFDLLPLWL